VPKCGSETLIELARILGSINGFTFTHSRIFFTYFLGEKEQVVHRDGLTVTVTAWSTRHGNNLFLSPQNIYETVTKLLQKSQILQN